MAIIELNKDNFEKEVLKYMGLVLIDFYADWCGSCPGVSHSIEKLAESEYYNSSVKLAMLNTGLNPDISVKYGITSLPQILFFRNGQELIAKRLRGAKSFSDYKKKIDSLLA